MSHTNVEMVVHTPHDSLMFKNTDSEIILRETKKWSYQSRMKIQTLDSTDLLWIESIFMHLVQSLYE